MYCKATIVNRGSSVLTSAASHWLLLRRLLLLLLLSVCKPVWLELVWFNIKWLLWQRNDNVFSRVKSTYSRRNLAVLASVPSWWRCCTLLHLSNCSLIITRVQFILSTSSFLLFFFSPGEKVDFRLRLGFIASAIVTLWRHQFMCFAQFPATSRGGYENTVA